MRQTRERGALLWDALTDPFQQLIPIGSAPYCLFVSHAASKFLVGPLPGICRGERAPVPLEGAG